MSENKKNSQWQETLSNLVSGGGKVLGASLREIYDGLRFKTIPLHILGGCSLAIATLIATRMFWFFGPYRHPKLFLFFSFIGIALPFIAWGIYKLLETRGFLEAATTTFRNAGLVTPLNRIPQYLSHQKIDDGVWEIKFARNGVLFSQFVQAKEHLEDLFKHIEEFIDHGNGEISLRYSLKTLPQSSKIYELPVPSGPYSFAIGNSRSGLVTTNLTKVPHMLIAGSTNSGKSTFIRQFLATLLIQNKGLEVKFIDLKYNLESQSFRSIKGVTAISSPNGALSVLETAASAIETRADFLVANECQSIEKLLEKSRDQIKWSQEVPNLDKFGRLVIVIDEAAELFLAGSRMEGEEAQRATRLAMTIAAAGRAVGIHLIIATQRPDRDAVDTKIKANLTGRLVFHMADHASSMTALDNTRAAQIPNEPGRAIWRDGKNIYEVKTLLLESEDLDKLFKRHKLKIDVKAPEVKEPAKSEPAPDAEMQTR